MLHIHLLLDNGLPVKAYWDVESAIEARDAGRGNHIIDIPMQDLYAAVSHYFDFRGLKYPSQQEAFLFLTSEIGELADEIVQEAGGWVRNNPQNKGKGAENEMGDVVMMLCMTAMKDPIELMFRRWKEKGYDREILND